MNVQEAVSPNPTPFVPHTCRLEGVVGWRTINDAGDLHSFMHHNFGVRAGKACVVDYVSSAMRKVILLYADRIHNDLDLVSPP